MKTKLASDAKVAYSKKKISGPVRGDPSSAFQETVKSRQPAKSFAGDKTHVLGVSHPRYA